MPKYSALYVLCLGFCLLFCFEALESYTQMEKPLAMDAFARLHGY